MIGDRHPAEHGLLTTLFAPDDKDITVCKQWLTVAGTAQQKQPLQPDVALQKTIQGVAVTMTTSPEVQELKAGEMVMLNFHLADAKTHQPIQHLEPYLGTSGHCVVLDESGSRYLHVHAMENMSGGADVMFHTQFPADGLYKIWGQFQVYGQVITAPFVVQVK